MMTLKLQIVIAIAILAILAVLVNMIRKRSLALSRLSNSVRTLDQMVALNEKRLQDLEQELKKEKEKNEEKTDHHRM